jgi:hypothetical protein
VRTRSLIYCCVSVVLSVAAMSACETSPTTPTEIIRSGTPTPAAVARAAATATPARTARAADVAPTPVATLRPDVLSGTEPPNAEEVTVAVADAINARHVSKEAVDQVLSEDTAVDSCTSKGDGFRDCGDPNATRAVLLFGDSKAGMWGPALDHFGKEQGWHVVVQSFSGCPAPDYPVWSDQLKRRFTECDKFRSSVVDNVQKLHPAVVLMSSNYAEDYRVEKDGKPFGVLSPSIWSDAVATMMGRLKGYADRIIILGNVPGRPQDPVDCVSAHLEDVRWCNTPRPQAVDLGLQHQTSAERAAAQQNGAEFIDTVAWFCTGSYCPDTVAGMIVLRDTAHVSVQYSDWLRDVLATAAGLR